MTAEALLAGQPASRAAAIAAAAALLGASANPLIAGLATDIDGAEAAIGLARAVGGVLDHAAAAGGLRDLDVMRQAGWIITTPLLVRARADCILLVGDGVGDFPTTPPTLAPAQARRVLRLPGGAALPHSLALLRALLAGRKLSASAALHEIAEALRTAQCGVVIWSAAHTDGLCIEMVCGMIDDLNRATRCFGLPLPGPDNLAGVMQAIGWQCGFPLRVGFARGHAEHDPWRFDAARMAAAGEADVVLWIGAALPDWATKMSLIALLPAGTAAAGAEVTIFIGRPGVDHDAVLHEPATGALGFRRGQGDALSAAAVLTAITRALGVPC